MNINSIRELLGKVQNGTISIEQAMKALRHLPYEDLGFAKVDHHRQLRQGFPEAIYCPGKTTDQIVSIAKRLTGLGNNILATRAEPKTFERLKEIFPEAEYNSLARTVVIKRDYSLYGRGNILVLSAGTADLPVAEEAALTAEVMGNRVDRLYDVGVAGIHRLLDNREMIENANVLIVIAGMEGALASVVGGLVSRPVIAVPTSIGYGANFQGLAPLLTMLNSCASGIAVVNIDNGFGAGYMAALINRVEKEV